MKTRLSLLIACTMAIGFAAEPASLPLDVGTLNIAGRTYEGAKIVSADAVGVKIVHDSGTGRIPYEKLPYELASRFPRDPEAAQAQKESEAAALLAYEHEQQAAELVQQAKIAKELEENGGRPRMSKADAFIASQKAERLENYITYLKMGISNAQGEIETKMLRAARTEARRSSYYVSYGGYGGSSTGRGYTIRMQAVKYKVQIAKANILISDAQRELARLEGAR